MALIPDAEDWTTKHCVEGELRSPPFIALPEGILVETPRVWPSPVAAWWAIAVFTIAAAISYTDRQILSLLVDPIRGDLGISDTQISILQGAAFAIIYSIAGLPLGRLADVLPRRRLLIAGVVIWSLGTISCGVSTSFTGLVASRFLVGIGEAVLSPVTMSMVGDLFPPHKRGSVIGVLWFGMTVGSGLALWVGGSVLHAAQLGTFAHIPFLANHAAWRTTLLVLGPPGFIVALLLLTVKNPARSRDHRKLPLPAVVVGLRARSRLLLPILGAGAMASIVDFSLLGWVPSLLIRNYRYSPEVIGLVLGVVVISMGALGAIAGGLLSDRVAKRDGTRGRISAALAASTLGLPLLSLPLTDHAWQVIALIAWWSLASGAAGTMFVTIIQESVPGSMRGVATSLIAFANNIIGLGLGATATAFLTDYVFADRLRIAASLGSVDGPAVVLAALFLLYARKHCAKGTALAED